MNKDMRIPLEMLAADLRPTVTGLKHRYLSADKSDINRSSVYSGTLCLKR